MSLEIWRLLVDSVSALAAVVVAVVAIVGIWVIDWPEKFFLGMQEKLATVEEELQNKRKEIADLEAREEESKAYFREARNTAVEMFFGQVMGKAQDLKHVIEAIEQLQKTAPNYGDEALPYLGEFEYLYYMHDLASQYRQSPSEFFESSADFDIFTNAGILPNHRAEIEEILNGFTERDLSQINGPIVPNPTTFKVFEKVLGYPLPINSPEEQQAVQAAKENAEAYEAVLWDLQKRLFEGWKTVTSED